MRSRHFSFLFAVSVSAWRAVAGGPSPREFPYGRGQGEDLDQCDAGREDPRGCLPAGGLDGHDRGLCGEQERAGRQDEGPDTDGDDAARGAHAQQEDEQVAGGHGQARSHESQRRDQEPGQGHAAQGAGHGGGEQGAGLECGGEHAAVERVEAVEVDRHEEHGDQGPRRIELAFEQDGGEPRAAGREQRGADGQERVEQAQDGGEEPGDVALAEFLERGERPCLLEHVVDQVQEVGQLAGRGEQAGGGDAEHAGDEEPVDAGAHPPEQGVGDQGQGVRGHGAHERAVIPVDACQALQVPARDREQEDARQGAEDEAVEVAVHAHAQPCDEHDRGAGGRQGDEDRVPRNELELVEGAGDVAVVGEQAVGGVGGEEEGLVVAEPAEDGQVEQGQEQCHQTDAQHVGGQPQSDVAVGVAPVVDGVAERGVAGGQGHQRHGEGDDGEGHVGDAELTRGHVAGVQGHKKERDQFRSHRTDPKHQQIHQQTPIFIHFDSISYE